VARSLTTGPFSGPQGLIVGAGLAGASAAASWGLLDMAAPFSISSSPSRQPALPPPQPAAPRHNAMVLRRCCTGLGAPAGQIELYAASVGTDFYFCGGKTNTGTPYCGYHGRVAYQPRVLTCDKHGRCKRTARVCVCVNES
jgi:hypothetical protein